MSPFLSEHEYNFTKRYCITNFIFYTDLSYQKNHRRGVKKVKLTEISVFFVLDISNYFMIVIKVINFVLTL